MIHHPLDFDDMILLVSISKTKSLTRTSEELSIAIGNIRKRVAKMEALLGQPIYTRKSTGIALTRIGEELSVFYEDFLNRFSSLKDNFQGLEGQDSKQIFTIATTQGIANSAVIPVLSEFLHLYPNVNISLLTYSSERELMESYADVIIWTKIDAHRYRYDLKIDHFFTAKFCLFASQDYIKAHGNPENQKKGHIAVRFFDFNSSPFSESSNQLFAKVPAFEISQEIKVTSHPSMFNLIKGGVGIGSVWSESPLITENNLIPIFQDYSISTDTYIITRKNIPDYHPSIVFSKFLKSYI
ncbi:LysR family transcriptional regulator [Candidatus Bealeia paramacronuclearis]|uniref:LysR family transcriptional regulator n=1 Tax=Candidatus Bealeia paramacronuclearis TaxID=1921001 RepID=A0ABZ2C2V6_9PROT|nr:LysR family transcriptional regulator [Candidatus Bealeia paramacronuclearis]